MSPLNGFIKNSCLNKSKFFSRFTLFKHVKKNKLSECFCALFCDSHFLGKKEKFSVNLPKNVQNNRKAKFISLWPTLREKTVLLIFVPFYWFDQKKVKSKYSKDFPLFKHVKKNKLSEFLCAHFWESLFGQKKRSSLWFSPKNASKQQKSKFCCMWFILRTKTVFVNICPLLQVWSKTVV